MFCLIISKELRNFIAKASVLNLSQKFFSFVCLKSQLYLKLVSYYEENTFKKDIIGWKVKKKGLYLNAILR